MLKWSTIAGMSGAKKKRTVGQSTLLLLDVLDPLRHADELCAHVTGPRGYVAQSLLHLSIGRGGEVRLDLLQDEDLVLC